MRFWIPAFKSPIDSASAPLFPNTARSSNSSGTANALVRVRSSLIRRLLSSSRAILVSGGGTWIPGSSDQAHRALWTSKLRPSVRSWKNLSRAFLISRPRAEVGSWPIRRPAGRMVSPTKLEGLRKETRSR